MARRLVRSGESLGSIAFPETNKLPSGVYVSKVSPDTGRKTQTAELNMDQARKSGRIQSMADNLRVHADRAKSDPSTYQEGLNYYANEHSNLADIGKDVNARRSERGMVPYYDGDHTKTGLAIASQASQGANEKARMTFIEKARSTGEFHGRFPARVREGMDKGTDPLNMTHLKLTDYAGSQMHPDSWSGRHPFVSGHTIDRIQYAAALDPSEGRVAGDAVHLTGTPKGQRLINAHKAANVIAQEGFEADHGTKLSHPQFQAVVWGGARGGFTGANQGNRGNY